MKLIRSSLLVMLGIFLIAASMLSRAQETPLNALEAISVVPQTGGLTVRLTFRDPLLALPAGFSVARPARLVLDFPNMGNGTGKSLQSFNEGDLRSINIVQAEGRARLVFNLARAMSHVSSIDGRHLLVSFTAQARSDDAVPPAENFAPTRPSAADNSIRDVSFRRGKDGEARITVQLADNNAGIDIRQQGAVLVVDFIKAGVPEALRKRLDVTDFATPVTSVSTVQQGANARMTIVPTGLWEHNAYQSDNQFVIEVRPVVENSGKLVQGSRGGYQGEKLSLNFQNVEVRRLLQVIGEFTGLNVVVSDSVSGNITLILREVPWDQALDIILQQKGLDMRKNGNVILIAPRDEIAAKEKLDFETKAQIGDLEPVRTESFQLNYQKAEAIQKLLTDSNQRMLSKRGSAVVDARTNMLFVQDTAARLEDVRQLIAKVDLPVRQVLIEARIVEAADTFSKNLGVRLGYNEAGTGHNGGRGFASGNYSVGAGLGTQTGTGGTATPGTIGDGLNVNLPATPRSGKAGALSFILFNASRTQFLNMEISALEADGRGKVVSSPRVMTANQIEALIEQGVEIPYRQATSSGATSIAFRKASLALRVKPQITPDGKITMSLDVNKDTPSATDTGGAGVAIDTKHIKTEVLVENGGTVVIGGIYQQNLKDMVNRIPVLGSLPYVGFLFRNTEKIDDKTELLVFITPKIVDEALNVR